jgi:alpha-beta hydrolase superfamily lysophospholipase
MTTHHEEGPLARQVTGGPRLYSGTTLPDGGAQRARVVVGLLHGYADHGARYAHVVEAWAEKGIATVTLDMRGHGRAEGKRGFCERFGEYLDDVAELEKLVRDRAPGVPAILFGHSFGGLVAASAALDRPSPWKALVLSAPFFGLAKDLPAIQVFAGRLIARVAPGFAMPTGLSGSDVTHDAARARAYDEDPLVFKKAPVRWFVECQAAQARALARAKELTMPLYVVMGTKDHVAKVASAKAFFDGASSADKTWDASEGHFHEVLNEPEWRPVADRLANWMLAHA